MLGAQVRGEVPIGPFDSFSNVGGHATAGGRIGFFAIPELEVGYGFQAQPQNVEEFSGEFQTRFFEHLLTLWIANHR